MNRGGRREQVAEKKPVEEERGVVALYVDGCSIHIERIFKAGINSGGLLIRQIESGTQKPLSFSSFVRYSFSPFRSLDEIFPPRRGEVCSIRRKIFEGIRERKEEEDPFETILNDGWKRKTSINGDNACIAALTFLETRGKEFQLK